MSERTMSKKVAIWKSTLVAGAAFCGLAACDTARERPAAEEKPVDVLQFVDPFIGTAGDHGQLHPGAGIPFGMIQVGPETPGRSHSGYNYDEATLLGFSHNRSSGVGCRGAGGNVVVRADYDAPADGAVPLHKDTEFAAPGYYRTEYGADRIEAEMTATRASGWQRYRFPRSGTAYLTVDTGHAHHRLYDARYAVRDDASVTGAVTGATVCDEGKYTVYFSLSADRPPAAVHKLDERRFALEFDVAGGDRVMVTTALSSVDEEAASRQRLDDTANRTFETVRAQAEDSWRTVLSKLSVSGGGQDRTFFYTSLFRVYHSPYRLATPGERYRESDGSVQSAGDDNHYFGWSVWDTFRTKHPLLTITEPAVARDIGRSLARLYEHGKQSWATDTEPYPTVRTEHSGIVLLDLWRKGLADFDAQALLPLLAEEADGMPRNSPDQILEAAYDDWAVGIFARLLGDQSMASDYLAKAAEYRPLWNAKFRHMGDDADIMHGHGLYEGTLWQYRWFVPFDTDWLVRQMGGPGEFTAQLAYFFDQGLYNMGNQPDIQAPFMFNKAGAPWRTQRQVRHLLTDEGEHWYGTHDKKATPYVGCVFRPQPEAFIPEMDDDAGTMSAWYVLAAMGLYPVATGVPVYSLHTPLFENIQLATNGGRPFEIRTSDPAMTYIAAARLNGEPLDRAWITHDEIVHGGVLEIMTSAQPNPEWGKEQPCRTVLDAPPEQPCAGSSNGR